MYEPAPDLFKLPPNMGAPIWRYTDVPKFVSILSTGSLYFCSPRLLIKLDKWEAIYPEQFLRAWIDALHLKTKASAEDFLRKIAWTPFDASRHPGFDQMNRRVAEMNADLLRERRRDDLAKAFVNCWHINEYESHAMWKLYGTGDIAIRSTIQRLQDSFANYKPLVRMGEVEYIDHLTAALRLERDDVRKWGSNFAPLFLKHKSFSYENELRVMTFTARPRPRTPGIVVPVDLNQLIESVYISPRAPKFFKGVVTSLLKHYGRDKISVVPSTLKNPPPGI
jgi:hypothetical protein